MWHMIPSLDPLVQALVPAFTQPAFHSGCQLLLAWVMCLGHHTLHRVAASAHPETLPDHSQRHGLDTYYNFFERSAWTPGGLAQRVAVLVLTRLNLGNALTLLVDDTLAHKRGRAVWGLGWFRDAVASTHKRVATASGHNWVVVAVAVCLPGTGIPILALPLLARLHLPGKAQRSCPEVARLLLAEVLAWFPDRRFILVPFPVDKFRARPAVNRSASEGAYTPATTGRRGPACGCANPSNSRWLLAAPHGCDGPKCPSRTSSAPRSGSRCG